MCNNYKPDTKSNPNPTTTKQHAIMNIHLNIVKCTTYTDKFMRDSVIVPLVPNSVVIVTLPSNTANKNRDIQVVLPLAIMQRKLTMADTPRTIQKLIMGSSL